MDTQDEQDKNRNELSCISCPSMFNSAMDFLLLFLSGVLCVSVVNLLSVGESVFRFAKRQAAIHSSSSVFAGVPIKSLSY